MRLLAIDPGLTTGWCVFDDGVPTEWGHSPWWETLEQTMATVDAVVCERFALYGSKAAALTNNEFPAVQVIGVVKYLAQRRDVPVSFQPASAIHTQGRLTPPLRRRIDPLLPRTSAQRHARDAMAHGFVFLATHPDGLGAGKWSADSPTLP